MARYEFTNAAGNRLVESCLEFNTHFHIGEIPYSDVEDMVRKEEYGGEYAVHKFVEWLKANAKTSSSAAKVLGLVALGMATQMVRDHEFIGKVESFHTAMNRRFGVDGEDILKAPGRGGDA
jgi:hypothetical protein